MKVIFLDLDGVLNTGAQWTAGTSRRNQRDSYGDPFCDDAVHQLGRILEATSAEIVISSTWRMSGLGVMRDLWVNRSLPGTIYDITPVFSSIRGLEVSDWLGKHRFFPHLMDTPRWAEIQVEEGAVTNYCIIDDDSDFLLYQGPHFVHCNAQTGLTPDLADKAIRILNSPPTNPNALLY